MTGLSRPSDPQCPPRILIVVELALMRGLLAASFAERGYEVATEDAAAGARWISRRFQPDVALIDVDLGPGPNGFELAHALLIEDPDLAIVLLADASDPRFTDQLPLPSRSSIAFLPQDRRERIDGIIEAAATASAAARDARAARRSPVGIPIESDEATEATPLDRERRTPGGHGSVG